MDEVDRRVVDDPTVGGDVAAWSSAHEHAEHLRRRINALAEDIAVSEDTLARVYEQSARLRPHAAPRLQEAARQARAYAERERRAVRTGELGGSPRPASEV